jgi:cytochrome c oxidase subunit 2
MLPESASSIAPKIDQLFWVILWITGAFFFLVEGALLVFVLRYRARPGVKADYIHGHTALEVIWTVIPALILLGLALVSQRVWAEIRYPSQRPMVAETIEIVAEQFAWNIRYPGPDRRLNTPDDLLTMNQLHLPVGKPVKIELRSKDVIHSLFIPEFRIKQDAVPGLTTEVWVEATRPGQFEIRCAELCGLGHYRMRGFVTTEPISAFEAWERGGQSS